MVKIFTFVSKVTIKSRYITQIMQIMAYKSRFNRIKGQQNRIKVHF